MRVVFKRIQELFEFGPIGAFLAHKLLNIDDHSNCLCLTETYSETSCAVSRSSDSIARWMPRRLSWSSSSRRLLQAKWPPSARYTHVLSATPPDENSGCAV